MEWLKQLLGEELFNQSFPKDSDNLKKVTEKIGAKKFIEDDGKLIPKHRFDEINTKLTDPENGIEALTKKLQKVTSDLEEAKKGNKADPTLEERLKALEDSKKELEDTIKEKDVQIALKDKRALVAGQFRKMHANEDYLQTLMREFELKHPLDKLEIAGDKFSQEQIDQIFTPFQDSYKPMFGVLETKGFNPKAPKGNAGDFYSMDELGSMSKEDIKSNFEKVQKSYDFHNTTN